tara:strand:- start:527 stop:730 length:204 start_codon:yes stop_codon:yes gene_type:complete
MTLTITTDTVDDVMNDYIKADFPGFPDSEPFVERLIALGSTVNEAVDELTQCWIDNTPDIFDHKGKK